MLGDDESKVADPNASQEYKNITQYMKNDALPSRSSNFIIILSRRTLW